MDYENYDIKRNPGKLTFTNKNFGQSYFVEIDENYYLSSKYNISLLLTDESDIELYWNFDKFRIIKKWHKWIIFNI